jgi:hypothetical protein
VSAAGILLDRGWGKPAQPHAGEDGRDIRVTIRKLCQGGDEGDLDLPFHRWRASGRHHERAENGLLPFCYRTARDRATRPGTGRCAEVMFCA